MPEDIRMPIVTCLVGDLGAEISDDFRCMFSASTSWSTEVLANIQVRTEECKQPSKLASRVKQVWEAIPQAHDEHRGVIYTGRGAFRIDELLDELELVDMREMFWIRHKIKYPSDIPPGMRWCHETTRSSQI